VKNVVTGGGRTGGQPTHDAGYLKRAEGLDIGSLAGTLVDSGGGAVLGAIAVGVGVQQIAFDANLAAGPPAGTSAADMVTDYVPGFKFKLLAIDFVTSIAGTGSSASQLFNLAIGSVDVTLGVCTVTLASTNAVGELTAGAAITGAQEGSATDAISIEMAASGTAFTAGAGTFIVTIQNMDVADAFAALVAGSALVADETNARVLKIEQTVDTAGNIVFPIPRDYDEATDELRLRVLVSQLTLSTDDDVKLDVELYRKRAAVALSADLAPSFTADSAVPVLTVAEQWIEFDLSSLTFLRDDVAIIELITNGGNDTAGEEVLIHAIELVYRSTLVSYDDEDDAQSNSLR
ncbi:hypothetical protein LCGC14_1707240, partial [marine sediment metagenome]